MSPLFQRKTNEIIDEVLNNYNGAEGFAKLGTILNENKYSTGPRIRAEHKLFQGYSLSLFKLKSQRHDINYVIENIKGDSLDKKHLKTRYEEYHSIYKALIEEYLSANMKLEKVISDTKFIGGNITQKSEHIIWDAYVRNKLPQLRAHICALWTLQNADHYFEAKHLQDKDNYILQAHAAEVISVFRVLGIPLVNYLLTKILPNIQPTQILGDLLQDNHAIFYQHLPYR